MANGATSVYNKAQKVSGTALGLLRRELVLGNVVTTYGIDAFKGALNDTINIPIRARATADTMALRATGEDRKIVVRDLQESSISVKLDKNIYSAVGVTDEQETLDIESFAEQVLEPQVVAVAETVEAGIITQMRATKFHANNGVTWNTHEESSPKSGAFGSFVRAQTVLDKWNVPKANRVMLVGPGAYAEILVDKRLDSANPEGLGSSALRDAVVGRLAGVPIVVSNLVNDDEAYLFHRSAFVFAGGAPVVPKGVYGGSTREYAGFAMRWLMDYDALYQTNRSVLTTYAGFGSTQDGPTSVPLGGGTAVPTNVRAVKLTLVNTDPTP